MQSFFQNTVTSIGHNLKPTPFICLSYKPFS